MTRRITQTFDGWDQPVVIVTITNEHGEEHPCDGVLRAWAVDDETRDWWAMCSYHIGTGVQMLGWIHQTQVQPVVELTDEDGLVAPGVVVALPTRDT